MLPHSNFNLLAMTSISYHTDFFVVILSVSEVSINSKRIPNSLDFSLAKLTQNDKSGVDFFAAATL